MQNRYWIVVPASLLMAVAIAACGSTPVPPTATPEPTETPAPPPPPTQPPAAAREGMASVAGTLTAYETGERVEGLYVYFFAATRDAQGQISVSPDVVLAGQVPQSALDGQGNFSAELPAGQYVMGVTDQPDNVNAPNFSPVGTADREVVFLDLNDGDTETVDGFVLLGRIVTLPGPTPPIPTVIDAAAKDYYAVIKTEKGVIKARLYDDLVPMTVNNFVHLARDGFYDGVTFHRVLDNFMAQTGDPTGTGSGGPDYRFADEFVPELKHDAAGILSMANAGPNTNGSQFFITFVPTPWLDGQHTVFGKAIEGLEVLDLITRRDPQANPDAPPGDRIETIEIEEVAQGAQP